MRKSPDSDTSLESFGNQTPPLESPATLALKTIRNGAFSPDVNQEPEGLALRGFKRVMLKRPSGSPKPYQSTLDSNFSQKAAEIVSKEFQTEANVFRGKSPISRTASASPAISLSSVIEFRASQGKDPSDETIHFLMQQAVEEGITFKALPEAYFSPVPGAKR